MAECVSCGKEIPAGKLFCDECYVKMKGRRGTLRGVPKGNAAETVTHEKPEEAGGESENVGMDVSPEGARQDKKASGTLTPTSGKKVISMKPEGDGGGKEKGKARKKFTVTITFSERTYAALARLRRSKGTEKAAAGKEKAAARKTARQKKASLKGPHGRPKLKSVTSATTVRRSEKRGLAKVIGYRDRAVDKGDLIAFAMASISTLLIVVLSFTNWIRLSWVESEGTVMRNIEIKGTDLGVTTYICMALAIVAFLYMISTWLFKGPFTRVDYGVVLIVAGLVFIPLFYSNIASNEKILRTAAALAEKATGSIPELAQFERQTLWTTYTMVLMGSLLALSGLVRLAERGGGGGSSRQEEGSIDR